ncbi:MAG: hypothetical protein WB511_00385 [Nitrososphaeraceae archaeon]
MDKISRMFKVGDNATTKTANNDQQRTASVANNSNLEHEQNDLLCA